MYNIDKNTYSCDICGYEGAWDAHDDIHGEKQGKASGASPKKKVFESDRYKMAKSCQYCTDTGDSFDRYVSTYCHLKHEHMFGFSGKDTLDQCFTCKNYKRRTQQ